MIIRNYKEQVKLSKEVLESFRFSKMLFLDIEVTGFNKEEDTLFMIGFSYFSKDSLFIKQILIETLEEEEKLLLEFKKYSEKYPIWCTFNGKALDYPFIMAKMNKFNIKINEPMKHFDFYRILFPYKDALCIKSMSLKGVEEKLGIERIDKIDGKDVVDLYKEYMNGNSVVIDNIFQHNYEDVYNLVFMFNYLYRIKKDDSLKPSGRITEKQYVHLRNMLRKRNIKLPIDIKKISKRNAARLIYNLINGENEVEKLMGVIEEEQ